MQLDSRTCADLLSPVPPTPSYANLPLFLSIFISSPPPPYFLSSACPVVAHAHSFPSAFFMACPGHAHVQQPSYTRPAPLRACQWPVDSSQRGAHLDRGGRGGGKTVLERPRSGPASQGGGTRAVRPSGTVLVNALEEVLGMSEAEIAQKIICCRADGAAVMTVSRAGGCLQISDVIERDSLWGKGGSTRTRECYNRD
jgi:hypothetical protein